MRQHFSIFPATYYEIGSFFLPKTKKSKIKNVVFPTYSIQIQYTTSDSINKILISNLVLLWLQNNYNSSIESIIIISWLIIYFCCHWPSLFHRAVTYALFPSLIHHIYTYIIHYEYAYNYALHILSEEGDQQQLLRVELKLVQLPTNTILVVIDF